MPRLLVFETSRVSSSLTRAAQKPLRKLDVERYKVEPPVGPKANDVSEWRKAIDNAQAQLEHSSNRLINLELTTKYVQKVWLKHLAELDAVEKG